MVGHMAMHSCQIAPPPHDAPLAPESPLRACVTVSSYNEVNNYISSSASCYCIAKMTSGAVAK